MFADGPAKTGRGNSGDIRAKKGAKLGATVEERRFQRRVSV
jgi:hypothetical protein